MALGGLALYIKGDPLVKVGQVGHSRFTTLYREKLIIFSTFSRYTRANRENCEDYPRTPSDRLVPYTHMLYLYIRTGCPYSAKVLEEAKKIKLEIQTKNIAYADVSAELKARGGKLQTPYLVDEENKVEMYESQQIIEYLHHRFSGR